MTPTLVAFLNLQRSRGSVATHFTLGGSLYTQHVSSGIFW